MTYTPSNLQIIIESEPDVVAWSREVAAPFAAFAENAFEQFATAVTHAQADRLLFRGAYSHVRKMAGLAVLSALRQHRVENALNLRQVIEGTSLFGYLARHPEITGGWAKPTATIDDIFKSNDLTRNISFEWIAKEFPELSDDLRFYKDHINRNLSHATILNTTFVFDYRNVETADERFFDVQNEHETCSALMVTGQVITLATIMLFKVSRDSECITLRQGIEPAINGLMKTSLSLRERLLADYDHPPSAA